MEYNDLKYREKFGLTPDQFREIDLEDLLKDYDMLSIEAEFQEQNSQNK